MIEPELSAVTTEILATIAREVPEYARPFEGAFGRGVQVGVTEALRQFVALIRDPDSGREPGRDVYIGLGRGELRQGRTLDALQSAYRVGARVAWRRLAEAARGAGLDSGVISTLAESIFAYIEELSADSVEGYAEARRGSGTFTTVPGGQRRAHDRALMPGTGGEDVIDLNCAAHSAPPGLVEAYQRATEELPAYLSGPGYFPLGVPALQARIAAAYEARGLPTVPEQVMVTAGALAAASVVAQAFTAPKAQRSMHGTCT